MSKFKYFVAACFLITIFGNSGLLKVQAQKTGNKTDTLKAYTSCKFDDGLSMTGVRRISDVKSRAVKTADGEMEVSRINSYEVLIAYPKKDPFASIRPETSEKNAYQQDKRNVIENLKYLMTTSGELVTTEPVKAKYNGFESYSFNRKEIGKFNTIGINVLFNDTDKTVTTIYLFNANPEKRSFQTIEEWQALKEKFLDNYTRCINQSSNR